MWTVRIKDMDEFHGAFDVDCETEKSSILPVPETLSVKEVGSYDHVRLGPQVPDVSARVASIEDKAYTCVNRVNAQATKA